MLGVLLVFKSKCKKRKVPPPCRRVIWKSCPLDVWIRSVRPPFTGHWLSIRPRSTLNSKQENLECDTFLITPILRKHCRVTDSNYLLVQNRGYSASPEVYTGSQGLWPYIFVVNNRLSRGWETQREKFALVSCFPSIDGNAYASNMMYQQNCNTHDRDMIFLFGKHLCSRYVLSTSVNRRSLELPANSQRFVAYLGLLLNVFTVR